MTTKQTERKHEECPSKPESKTICTFKAVADPRFTVPAVKGTCRKQFCSKMVSATTKHLQGLTAHSRQQGLNELGELLLACVSKVLSGVTGLPRHLLILSGPRNHVLHRRPGMYEAALAPGAVTELNNQLNKLDGPPDWSGHLRYRMSRVTRAEDTFSRVGLANNTGKRVHRGFRDLRLHTCSARTIIQIN